MATTHARRAPTPARDDASRVVRALLDHTLEPIVLTDIRGTAFLATAAAERLLGVSAGFFTERPLINMVARQDTRAFRAFMNEIERTASAEARTTNVRMRARNGEVFVATVRVTRFEGPQGHALHWRLSPVS